VTTDAGLLAVRELDEALRLTEMAGEGLSELRTWRNVRQELAGLLKQSVYARLAGYEYVNDQEVLARDPAHGGLFSDLPERIRCLAAVPR